MARRRSMAHDLVSVLRDPVRLASLRRTALLDTLAEDAFDRLIRVAARTLEVPMVFLTLVDEDRQFFKSSLGLPEPWASWRETPLSHSVCQYVVGTGEPLVVRDARADPRLHQSPAVREMGIVAYAGVPIFAREREAIGSFSAAAVHPREWSTGEMELLNDLAALAMREIDWRVGEQERSTRDLYLRRVERLASLGTLLSGVAHELNNPLASIKGFAQLLLLDERPEEDREALETIVRQATRAAKIVADLHVVARQNPRTGEPPGGVELNEVVRQVVELRRRIMESRGIEVREELSPGLPPVHGPRGELEQVVLNLLVNAEQSLAEHPGPRQVVIRTRPAGAGAVLQVVDSGAGIPAEHLERVFDPFWTTRDPGKGTGLGLSLVHGIVTAHGGEIRVESAPGEGAAFIVQLPRAPEIAPSAEPGVGEGVPRPLRVLVVDDEAPIRTSLVRYLERRGHRVDAAEDGREALRRVGESRDFPYDVVLADLRMPEVGGDRLLEALRGRPGAPDRRVVFVTGDAASEEAAEILAASGAPVILKPFDLAEVAVVVERHAERVRRGGEGTAG